MKKIILFFTFVIFAFLLVGCQKAQTKDVFLYLYIDAGSTYENVLELYNPTDNDIILDNDYEIRIYNNGSKSPKNIIKLKGEIKKNSFFIICDKDNPNIPQDKINFKISSLGFNGDDAIALAKNNKNIDILGYIGFTANWGSDSSLVKVYKDEFATSKFDSLNFVNYGSKRYDLLNKKIEKLPLENIFKGPQFDKNLLSIPFAAADGTTGMGGAIKVTVSQYIDGDTTKFQDQNGKTYYTRYAFIDTPESTPKGGFKPWGKPASITVNTLLKNAKNIYLQSIKGEALIGPFDRYWGIIWVDNFMLNFLVIKAGFSELGNPFGNSYEDNKYNDIPYLSYMKMIENITYEKKIGIHGQKDPTWDYKNDVLKEDYEYIPNLDYIYGTK